MKIHFLVSREVVSLVSGTGGSAIVGVRASRRGSTEAEEFLLVNLVVDASGQGSRAPR